ncbi:39S ribosomal protein L42, mitochondrial [Latimeria chalumnae]|uniref:Large ribosomal subunit protein mL42 n=1 Tax=Latimeria chalumnae TaxID=7897 RepID=H3ADU1_LATCH|nr:PREDICTED: 39S ribosomal protein L42, mitochondrial [Latimeria chalumnae]|eukprot:XP_006007467.1 PREDICTED: 39S ribosomal protein L42, mitochondrial [Latimeria chalumnae]
MAARSVLKLSLTLKGAARINAHFTIQGGGCQKSTYSALPDYNCKVQLALTSDDRTIVCYHPSIEIPYEHTKPIPRPDPTENKEETHEQILKARLSKEVLHNKQAARIEELRKMFYTTKHRWYPVGQYHRRRRNTSPPKDR